MFDAHQKLDNGDALLAAKRNVFVSASSSRRERNFIMLRAPDGSLSANHDLSFEDAFDAPGDGLISLRRPCFINKGVVRFVLGDVTQESHHPNHRVVVEGDVLIVTLLDRIILGPPTVPVLRFQQVIEPAEKRLSVPWQFLQCVDARQENHLCVSRAVIDRGIGRSFFFLNIRALSFA